MSTPNEVFEPVTRDTWTERMTELAEDSPEVDSEALAVAIGAWLEPHVDGKHGKTGLQWTKTSRFWEVHAVCGQCRRQSAAYQMGADPAVVSDWPEPTPPGHS